VTSNRPDWLSHFGVAREVHAATDEPLTFPDVSLSPDERKIESMFALTDEESDLCPRYTGRLILDVKVGPSPEWLQKKIRAIGLRPVNNVVDITNFVLFECGQPLHAFDFDKLAGGKIIVRRAAPGEEMTTIDGKVRKLATDMLVIADAERPVALAGVMGGLDTEVSDATANVLIESARFHPINIRNTSRETGLSSDSSHRFERGVDPERVDWASRRTCALIQELAGGTLLAGVADANFESNDKIEVALRYKRTDKLLGIEVEPEAQKAILLRLGFEPVTKDDERIAVRVPSHRHDVEREVDLIEEVARIHGYATIPEIPTLPICLIEVSFAEKLEKKIKELLVQMGLYEAYTYSFSTDDDKELFCPWTDAEPLMAQGGLYHEGKPLRRSILPSLLDVLRTNRHHGQRDVQIFEIANVFLPEDGRILPHEQKTLAALSTAGYYALKGVVGTLIDELSPQAEVAYTPFAHPFFTPKKAAEIFIGTTSIGYIGEVTGAVLERYDAREPVTGLEINADALEKLVTLRKHYRPLPTFPAIQRDLALVLDEKVTWKSVMSCICSVDSPLLERVQFLDEYRGQQLEAGTRSLALSLTFRAPDRTLRAEEAEEAESRILDALKKSLGAKLRER
jgi:phenylalanyl-tRNA synthetase beta chain